MSAVSLPARRAPPRLVCSETVATATLPYSRKQVDKCGRAVRDFVTAIRQQEIPPDDLTERIDQLERAIDVVEGFRAHHARPLAKVNAGLRYYVVKSGMGKPDVTQRLKRFATIVDKLQREPTMQLSKMEDIAGVRAVLEDQRQVDDIRTYLEKAPRWKIRRVRDYVKRPKVDGYRAIHLIVEKDGCYVEVQLRTPRQDTWAQSVEQDTRRLGAGLKFGSGPDDLRKYYQMVSEWFAMRENLEQPDEDFMAELAKLYAATRRYFPKGNGNAEGRTS